jgi:hypothetical protein
MKDIVKMLDPNPDMPSVIRCDSANRAMYILQQIRLETHTETFVRLKKLDSFYFCKGHIQGRKLLTKQSITC